MRDRPSKPPRDPRINPPPSSTVALPLDGETTQLRLEQELTASAERRDRRGMAVALAGLASIAEADGDPEPAHVLLEEARSLWPQLNVEGTYDSTSKSDATASTKAGAQATAANPSPDLKHR